MKLNVNEYKKVGSDKNMTILRHPTEGHEIRINHSKLLPKFKAELEGIKGFADGGEAWAPELNVGEPDYSKFQNPKKEQLPPPDESQVSKDITQLDIPGTSYSGGAPQEPVQENVPRGTPADVAPTQASAPMPDVYGTVPSQQAYMKGLGEVKKGIAEEAAAQGAQGQQEVKALDSQAQSIQNLQGETQKHFQEAMQERQLAINDLQKGHINPNQYWENKSLPQKIATAIGMILGGAQTADFVQHQIDKNIQAQQLNTENKHSLLNAMRGKYQDEASALDMTRVMTNDLVSNQLKKAAAQSMDPMAQARAHQNAGNLDMQSHQIIGQMASRRALLGGGLPASTDPSVLVQALVPEHSQKEVFKEIKDAQNASHIQNEMMKLFDEATKENTAVRSIGGLREPPSIRNMRALALPMIHDAEGRVNEYEAKTLFDLEPKGGDLDSTIQKKRAGLINFINQKKSAPTARGFGIDLNKFASTSTDPTLKMNNQQKQFYQWAKQNPNDPKAQMVLKKLGVQ